MTRRMVLALSVAFIGLLACAPSVGVLAGLMRFLTFGGLLVLVGGSAFIALLWPDGGDRRLVRRVLWSAWAAIAVGSILGMGLQAASVADLSLLDALKPSVINTTLDTTFGSAALARVLLLMPIAVLLELLPRARQLWWKLAGLASGLGLLLTLVLSGHAATGRWIATARITDLLHLLGAAVWLGGLAMLFVAVLRSDVTDARSITERFSTIGFGAVAVVALTGTLQSVRQVATLEQLETPYGRLLIVKVVTVLTLIGIASLTRPALQGRLTSGFEPALDGPGAKRPGEGGEIGLLRRLVGAEVVVAVLVLAVTALLVDANAGNAEVVASVPFDETHVVGDALINVVVAPGSVGPTDVHLYLNDPGGGLASPVDATATFSLESAGISSIDVPLKLAGPKHWSAYDLDLPNAGEWVLTVQIALTDVDTVRTTFTVPIGGAK